MYSTSFTSSSIGTSKLLFFLSNGKLFLQWIEHVKILSIFSQIEAVPSPWWTSKSNIKILFIFFD